MYSTSIIYVRVISYILKNKLNKNSTLQIYNFVYYSLSQLFFAKVTFYYVFKALFTKYLVKSGDKWSTNLKPTKS